MNNKQDRKRKSNKINFEEHLKFITSNYLNKISP